jgi:hypothetical protein
MTFRCRDLDAALRSDEPAALDAARAHAETCSACRESLAAWGDISDAAPGLRRSWDSPELWPRIHQALAEESQRRAGRGAGWRRWITVAAAAGLAALAASGLVLWRPWSPSAPAAVLDDSQRRLLTERALQQVESSEAEYMASIEKLAAVAEPLLEDPSSPLVASYREKLQLLDAAIAECRGAIERNRFNAHLRRELLSIYQEKQRTLSALLQEERT